MRWSLREPGISGTEHTGPGLAGSAAGAVRAVGAAAEWSLPPTVLRWRIHDGELSLRRRHMRALARLDLPDALMGWVHERLEWAMLNMLSRGSEAVLVLHIDPASEVRLSLQDIQAAPALDTSHLISQDGWVVGAAVDGQPLAGDIWCERGAMLYASVPELVTATGTLCRDLAQTMGFAVCAELQTTTAVEQAAAEGRVFLISDEFGFLPLGKADNSLPDYQATRRLSQAFCRLWPTAAV